MTRGPEPPQLQKRSLVVELLQCSLEVCPRFQLLPEQRLW